MRARLLGKDCALRARSSVCLVCVCGGASLGDDRIIRMEPSRIALVPFRPKHERCLLFLQRLSLRMPSVTRKWVFPRWHPNFGSSLRTGRKTFLIESPSPPLLALNFPDHRQESCKEKPHLLSQGLRTTVYSVGEVVFMCSVVQPWSQHVRKKEEQMRNTTFSPGTLTSAFTRVGWPCGTLRDPAQAGLEAYMPGPSIP